MSQVQDVFFHSIGSFDTGFLIAIESLHNIDFEIKRIYYIYNVKKNFLRGNHAHKSLKQILICVNGSIEIACDDGKSVEKRLLDNPGKALFVGPGIWRTMRWIKNDSTLLVLASDYYDEADYIRDYEIFKKNKKSG